jgi:hypothetical protein
VKDERLILEIRKDAVRSALIALEQAAEGEIWFHPNNHGDLGSLYVGDEFIATVRNYETRPMSTY